MTRTEKVTDSRGVVRCFVPETKFGLWFLRTDIWTTHVLERAIKDLERLIANREPSYPVIVDVGCGWGRSLKLLSERFAPERMIGVDIDHVMISASQQEVRSLDVNIEFIIGSSSALPLPDQSVDMVFCHQTFHHLMDQESGIAEFYRVLRPGGLLLFAESTRRYIHSFLIRSLFAHPMEIQKTSDQYLKMARGAGFVVNDDAVSYPYLWWSREDLGIGERWFGIPPRTNREQTLLNMVAVRPRSG